MGTDAKSRWKRGEYYDIFANRRFSFPGNETSLKTGAKWAVMIAPSKIRACDRRQAAARDGRREPAATCAEARTPGNRLAEPAVRP
jgi:hypothetical protein